MNKILSSILWLIVAISSASLYAETHYVKSSHAELDHIGTSFSWQTVMQEMQSNDIVQGQFGQSKHLKILKKPIQSSGTFTYVRHSGLIWHTEKPLPATIVIQGQDIYRVQDGQKNLLVKDKQQGISAILLHIMSGNLTSLNNIFDIDASNTNKGWLMALTPKKGNDAYLFSKIELTGQQHINRVILTEPQGSQTVIILSDLSNQPLSSVQQQLLEPVPLAP